MSDLKYRHKKTGSAVQNWLCLQGYLKAVADAHPRRIRPAFVAHQLTNRALHAESAAQRPTKAVKVNKASAVVCQGKQQAPPRSGSYRLSGRLIRRSEPAGWFQWQSGQPPAELSSRR